jgi:hypothetical protein
MKSKNINPAGEPQRSTDEAMAEDGRDALTKYFDGMGTATARIIINRHIDDNQWEKYGLKDLKHRSLLHCQDCGKRRPRHR